MSELTRFAEGGYSFLKGGFPYSQGVRALPGYAIERIRFARPLPVHSGFAAIERHLASLERPRTALCAVELRSPHPFSMQGFAGFNRGYVEVLKRWGLFPGGVNPVARSNVAPEIAPPADPVFYAFCCTVTAQPAALPSVVVAGSGEWPEGDTFPDDIVARGDVSQAGLRAKAKSVLDTMERRLSALGVSWAGITAAQVYRARYSRGAARADCAARGEQRRAHMALLPAAHRRAGVRDGCAQRRLRARGRLCVSRHLLLLADARRCSHLDHAP
jgi:hypothetical protein